MLQNQRVNPYFLHYMLGPLSGLGDDDASVRRFAFTDPDSETDVKPIFLEYIKPYLDRMNEAGIASVRLALSYYLSYGGLRFDRVWESLLMPFDAATDARQTFLWIWEVCFPNEDYHLLEKATFSVTEDIEEPRHIIRIRPRGSST